jgi:hypothetical protein
LGEGSSIIEKVRKTYHIITAVELHMGLVVAVFSLSLAFLSRLISPFSLVLFNIFGIGLTFY